MISLVTDPEEESTNHMLVHQSFRGGFKHSFGVCLGSAWEGPAVSPERWVEWMEANIIFGAEQFIIHNMSMPSYLDPYVQHYVDMGVLEVFPWHFDPIIKLASNTYNMQLATYRDCLYRMRRQTTYMVQVDLDELIVPRHPEDVTWYDMIQRSGCAPDALVYAGRQVHCSLQYPNNTLNKTGLVMLDATECGSYIFPNQHRTKYIAAASNITSPHMHTVSNVQSSQYCVLPVEVGANHHYRREIHPTMITVDTVTDNSALKYTETLTKQVSESLKRIHSNVK